MVSGLYERGGGGPEEEIGIVEQETAAEGGRGEETGNGCAGGRGCVRFREIWRQGGRKRARKREGEIGSEGDVKR